MIYGVCRNRRPILFSFGRCWRRILLRYNPWVTLNILNMFSALTRRKLRKTLNSYRLSPRPRTAAKAANLLLKLGRGDEAFRLAKKAKRAFPKSQVVADAHIKVRRKQAKQALKKTRLLIKQEPTLDLYIRASDLHRTLGEFERALSCLETAEKLFDDHWAVHLTLGKLYFARYRAQRNQADGEDATEHLRHAAALNPHGYSVLIHNAIVNSHLGHYEEATEAVATILADFPEDAKALGLQAHLARVLERDIAEENPATESYSVPQPVGSHDLSVEATADGSAFQKLAAEEHVAGVFAIGADGAVDFSSSKSSDTFDFEDADDAVRAIAADCRYNATSLGMGDLQSCHLVGDNWEVYLHAFASKHYVCFAEKCEGSESLANLVTDAVMEPTVA
jgi:tetratricopeptide (TPR) repeat protein